MVVYKKCLLTRHVCNGFLVKFYVCLAGNIVLKLLKRIGQGLKCINGSIGKQFPITQGKITHVGLHIKNDRTIFTRNFLMRYKRIFLKRYFSND